MGRNNEDFHSEASQKSAGSKSASCSTCGTSVSNNNPWYENYGQCATCAQGAES